MKNLTLKVFSFFLLSILFVGCEKNNFTADSVNSLGSGKVSPNKLPGPCPYDCHDTRCKAYYDGYCGPVDPPPFDDTISVITNSNNPYDSAGARHNLAINSIIENLSSETSTSEIVQLTLNYLISLSYDTIELRSEYNLSDSLGIFGYTDVDSLAYKMFASSEISSTAENYMLDFATLINNIIADNNPNDSLYEIFANSCIYKENTIVSDNSLSSDEKIMLLEAFSVGRYSAAYWGNYIENNTLDGEMSSIFKNRTESLLFRKKFWRKVLGADAGGAITGAGAAIQSSKGVLRGAIFGAIIGSAVTAVKELISPS